MDGLAVETRTRDNPENNEVSGPAARLDTPVLNRHNDAILDRIFAVEFLLGLVRMVGLIGRRLLSVLAVVVVSIYLWIGRGEWIADLERQAQIGSKPLYSDVLDVSRIGRTVWKIPREEWLYREGEAKLSLLLSEDPALPIDAADRSRLALRLKISVAGISERGDSFDRLVRNWYYTTDEPFDPRARLWSSVGGSEIEHGLAGVILYPFEATVVTIDVTTADARLAQGRPRLKLVGDYDYAVYEHIPFLRLIRDGGLVICLSLVVALAILASYPQRRQKCET